MVVPRSVEVAAATSAVVAAPVPVAVAMLAAEEGVGLPAVVRTAKSISPSAANQSRGMQVAFPLRKRRSALGSKGYI